LLDTEIYISGELHAGRSMQNVEGLAAAFLEAPTSNAYAFDTGVLITE
jgi:hypothetical protein